MYFRNRASYFTVQLWKTTFNWSALWLICMQTSSFKSLKLIIISCLFFSALPKEYQRIGKAFLNLSSVFTSSGYEGIWNCLVPLTKENSWDYKIVLFLPSGLVLRNCEHILVPFSLTSLKTWPAVFALCVQPLVVLLILNVWFDLKERLHSQTRWRPQERPMRTSLRWWRSRY